jgi:hypothetical protein
MIAVAVEQDVKVSEDLNAELKEGRKQIYGDSVGDSLSIKERDHSWLAQALQRERESAQLVLHSIYRVCTRDQ